MKCDVCYSRSAIAVDEDGRRWCEYCIEQWELENGQRWEDGMSYAVK